MKYLDKIKSPADVKNLNEDDLPLLAQEIREVLVDTVSQNGGHLASNLGVVELTIALHRVFDSPKDKIIWDVGHQAYTHKLLTGRYPEFETIRREGGLSGFTNPSESEHDIFYSGHSSTSISEALGVATANGLNNDKHTAIAVIGDGALTGGLAYEALNNAGRSKQRLIVILNDNEMSISKNVGSVARYLAVLRSKPGYFRLKARTEKIINRIPLIGKKISEQLFKSKTRLKNLIYKSTFFEDLGFRYMGPIDGHNITQLCEALEGAKMVNAPVLLHINTVKGKGYDFAEKSPSEFHGISKFNINTGEPVYGGTNFSAEFGDFLCDIASKDKRICAITAAMSLGTGLEKFRKQFPDRFYDVGIAEEHAVTFSSGLARGGMVPVFAVYSTFLQRCYDQLVHDGAMQHLHMIIAVDRAGFVGEDGISHQGILDAAFLNGIPGITVYSPSTYTELKHAFIRAIYHSNGVVAIRYPRGTEKPVPESNDLSFEPFAVYGRDDSDTFIVTYGRIYSYACSAADELISRGYNVSVLKLNRIKPISEDAVKKVLSCKKVFFFEEGIKAGGIGSVFSEMMTEKGFKGNFDLTAVDNEFVKHAAVSALLSEYSLDENGMIKTIMAGQVFVNGQKALKSGQNVKEDDQIEVRGEKMPFVSRGGYKLDKAVKAFDLSLQDKICMDIGASTGGFTDCMLQNGAAKVFSVDVGYGQLAWKLRTDERVVNMERTNFRYLTIDDIGTKLDFASVDVSFISLKIILPVLFELLNDGGEAVCLIKPQFEAGRDKVGKKGVVRDKETHAEVIKTITDFAFDTGFSVVGLDFSPIKGPEGNIEYLMYLRKEQNNINAVKGKESEVAELSHNTLQ